MSYRIDCIYKLPVNIAFSLWIPVPALKSLAVFLGKHWVFHVSTGGKPQALSVLSLLR